LNESVENIIQERINFAENRIKFWEGNKHVQQIWIGIKVELTLLLEKLK
jgi:hypothetical protein